MTALLIPLLAAGVMVYGFFHGCDVYAAFLKGVRQGLDTLLSIFPALLAMLTALAMLRASGAVEALSQALAPLTEALGIPAPCLPLALLRPFSGSGALSIGSDIIRSQGPDSLAGLTAAVMLGSSETSIYCIALYSAALGIKNTRWALPAALAGDLAAFFLSALSVRLFLL